MGYTMSIQDWTDKWFSAWKPLFDPDIIVDPFKNTLEEIRNLKTANIDTIPYEERFV